MTFCPYTFPNTDFRCLRETAENQLQAPFCDRQIDQNCVKTSYIHREKERAASHKQKSEMASKYYGNIERLSKKQNNKLIIILRVRKCHTPNEKHPYVCIYENRETRISKQISFRLLCYLICRHATLFIANNKQ